LTRQSKNRLNREIISHRGSCRIFDRSGLCEESGAMTLQSRDYRVVFLFYASARARGMQSKEAALGKFCRAGY
jgi:hypothetical protein